MATELRKTGMSIIGDVPWGTHFCHFYETKQDLLDTLVPYFKAGLESEEFCLWVVSNSELITVEEAKGALEQAVPDLDQHLSDGNIEILDGHDWYLKENVFIFERVMSAWDAKVKRALARGYDGLRASADTFWLAEKDWKDFFAYEKQVNDWITDQSMTVLCTYPLAKSGAAEVLDVVESHQFAIARRQGEWKVIESPELIQAKAEIKRLNEELEQRVVERTRELAATNEELSREIIERNRAEDALRDSRRYLQALFDNSLDAILVTNDEGRYIDANPAACALLGYTHEELMQLTILDITAEPFRQEGWALWQQFLARGSWSGEHSTLRKDRAVRQLEFRAVANILPGVHVASCRDITERKQAEEQLKQSERQLAEAQRLAHIGSWSLDLSSKKVTWSDELYRIFGVQPSEFDHRYEAVVGTTHPEDRDWLRSVIEDSIKTHEPFSVYYRIILPTGELRILQAHGAVVTDEHGNAIRMHGAAQDVTERKQAEEQLRATTEQLRALSARIHSAKEEEGARIAREIHDELGAALTSLRWDLESVDKVISELGDQPQLKVLRERIEAMLRLTETTISSVRRISSELRPSILDDLGLVEAIEWQAQQFQDRTGIICRCDCSLENLDLSREQSTAVFRILQEALTNILRHAQATRVDITTRAEAGEFVVAIIDNGRGITENKKSGSQSLGILGMQERAHLIGGKINVTGVEGKGTMITVRVPISG